MSHLVMINRLQKNTKLGNDKNIKALQIIILGNNRK